jgi:hypothetical protein
VGVSPLQLINLHRNRRYFVIKLHTWFCFTFLEDKHKILLHLSIFYEYQHFFNTVSVSWYSRPITNETKSCDYTCYSQWPVTHFSTFYQFILNMLFNHCSNLASARHFRYWRLIFESDEYYPYPIRHLNFQKIVEKCL